MDVTDRTARFRIVMRLLGVALFAVALVVSGCSGDDDARPDACGEDDSDVRAASEECKEALFDQQLDADATDELSEFSPEQRLQLAHRLCSRADEVLEVDGPRPLRSELLDDTATEWDLEPATVAELARAAEPLCPEQFAVLDSLPELSAQADVELRVEGTGVAMIEYTTSDGELAGERAAAPWGLTISLVSPGEVRVSVTPEEVEVPEGEEGTDAGPLRCSISIGGEVVAEATVEGDAPAVCSISRDELIAASNEATGASEPATPDNTDSTDTTDGADGTETETDGIDGGDAT